jgi:dUTP pyrophosphatase
VLIVSIIPNSQGYLNLSNKYYLNQQGYPQFDNPKFIVEKTHPNAALPIYGSMKAAGCDFVSPVDAVVPARGRLLIKTGLKMVIPQGFRIRLHSRSGLSLKHGIEVGAGLIDEDYRQEIGIILYNHSDVDFVVTAGDRIAQGCVERYYQMEAVEGVVPEKDEDSNRTGGYGSTGVGAPPILHKMADDVLNKVNGSKPPANLQTSHPKGANYVNTWNIGISGIFKK